MKEKLLKFDNNKLIDIAKNYKRYNYDTQIKDIAIEILNERGIKQDDLTLISNDKDYAIENLELILKDYKKNGLICLISYFMTIFLVTFSSGIDSVFLTILIIILNFTYLLFFIKSYLNFHDFFKKSDGEAFGPIQQITFFVIGIPLSFVIFFYSIREMKVKIKNKI